VPALLDVVQAHPAGQSIGLVSMTHRDRGTGRSYHAPGDVLAEGPGWRSLRSTITSGSLVRCEVLRRVGLFEERLFIDFVDHEFCLRLRRHGWLVVEAADVVLAHSMGSSQVRSVLGRRMVFTHHSPLRRYYITRNQLEVSARNLWFDPRWACRHLLHLAFGSVVVVLFEEQRLAKLQAVLRGVFDFATRRFGPRSGGA
jgi:rhamnosyltransferase